MTMFGGSSSVAIDSPATFGQLSLADDTVLPYLRPNGRPRASPWRGDHVPDDAYGPAHALGYRRVAADHLCVSNVREPEHRSFPKSMEIEDIRRVVSDFGAAARRCVDGGLDGCELSYAGFHLIPQFWSPLTNHRMDEYGGSLENRMRLGFDILAEIRRQVGAEYIVGVRLSGDELLEGGLARRRCWRSPEPMRAPVSWTSSAWSAASRATCDRFQCICQTCRFRWRPSSILRAPLGRRPICRSSMPRASRISPRLHAP